VNCPGGGLRHDYPHGLNLYTRIRVGDVRVRPFLTFCDLVSFMEPAQKDTPRADDVLLGPHARVGSGRPGAPRASLCTDLLFIGYAGHDRHLEGWPGRVDEELPSFRNLQFNIGGHVHLGRR